MAKEKSVEKKYLSVAQTATYLSISKCEVYKLIKQGLLKAYKLKKRTVIPIDEIENALEIHPLYNIDNKKEKE